MEPKDEEIINFRIESNGSLTIISKDPDGKIWEYRNCMVTDSKFTYEPDPSIVETIIKFVKFEDKDDRN